MIELWTKLSSRERLLALIVLVMLMAGVVLIVGRRAQTRLRDLDDAITQRQETLLNYAHQLARSRSVGRAYARVAAQHSSKWTEAEIHDRLLQEIYRLAMRKPPGPGAAVSLDNQNVLVHIPTLRQGTLRQGGEGYREYELAFAIPYAESIESVILFLERLQASDQTLRLDAVEINRAPTLRRVSAMVSVTRTVVDGTPEEFIGEQEFVPVHGHPSWIAVGKDKDEWQTERCVVSEISDDSAYRELAVKAKATGADARLYVTQKLAPARVYDLYLDAAADGPARLAVVPEAEGADDVFEEVQREIVDDGKTRQYRLRFTTPPSAGLDAQMRVPSLSLLGKDTQVYVGNIVLRKMES